MMNNQFTSTSTNHHKASAPGHKTQASMMEVLRLLRPQNLPESNAQYRPGYLKQGRELLLMHRDGRVAMHVRPAVLQGLLDQRLVVHRPGLGYVITHVGITAVNAWDAEFRALKAAKGLLQ